jgi:hypothetical protein
MFKITKTYKDYDGNEMTNDFYFSLSQQEIVELNFTSPGGLVRYIESIQKTNDGGEIIGFFKKILLASYGQKVFDPKFGTRFSKLPEYVEQFVSTPAFSMIYMDLATDAKLAADFIRGVVEDAVDIDDAEFNAAIAKASADIKPVN